MILTKNKIIEDLYTGKNFCDCISKMEPEHLRDDLKQEVIAVVCGWDDEKILKLHQDKVLEFYVVRVILNQIQSKSSPFHKKYRATHKELADIEVKDQSCSTALSERETKEALEDFALAEIDKLHWYRSGLIKLFLQVGNYRAMEKEVGIPFSSCYKNIQQSITLLRSKVFDGENKPLFSKEELKKIATP